MAAARPAPKYKKGNFSTYRVVHKLHLGKFEMDLHEDDYVEYDGYTLRVGEDTYNESTIRGAIKAGWLVPEDDTTSVYVPQPADIQIRPAQAAGSNERGPVRRVQTVDDEERVVGRVGEQRERVAAADARADRPNAPVKRMPVVTADGQDGVVAARLSTPTKSGSFDVTSSTVGRQSQEATKRLKGAAKAAEVYDIRDEDARALAAEEAELRAEEAEEAMAEDDNPEAVKAREKRLRKLRKARATGDVQEARTGDELDELLPEAASSGTPNRDARSGGSSDIDALRRLVSQGLVPQAVLDAALQKQALAAIDNDPDIASLRGMVEKGMVPDVVLQAAIAKKREAILGAEAPEDKGAAEVLGADASADEVGVEEGVPPMPPEEEDLDHTFQPGEGPELDDDDFGFEDPEEVEARKAAEAAEKAAEKEAMRKAAADALADADNDPVQTTKDTAAAVLAAKMEMAKSMVPGFEWDLSVQWRRRVKLAVENHGSDPLYINAIMAVETETVKGQIKRALEKQAG